MAFDRHRALILVATLLLTSACFRRAPKGPAPPPVEGKERTQFALRSIELAPGTGADAAPDKCLYVHYTGWLTDGKKFDSSRDTASNGQPRTPIAFQQGRRGVIAGWDLGFEGMKVGGRRRLIIPYQLAYGVNGRPPVIPPKSTLVFDVELMDVRDGPPAPPQGSPPGTPPARCPAWSS
jgi:peptidylprolyl isomerase